MEAYTPTQLPMLNGLANAYAVSDALHASVPSQVDPNRAFSLCGTPLARANHTLNACETLKFDQASILATLLMGCGSEISEPDLRWKQV
jgi:phospholipase C